MMRQLPIAMIVSSVASTIACGQLVSVRCCTEQADLQQVRRCLSGPGNTEPPDECPPTATCVLAFGEHQDLMTMLCDAQLAVPPVPLRAYCSSWNDETATVSAECVAKAQASVNLFSVYDDDADGDLDLRDLAGFGQVYGVTPALQQSEAVLVSVECCVPEFLVREIGACLSGPGSNAIPAACDASANCVYGFSAPIELGDWHHTMCAPGNPILPHPSYAYCVSWQNADLPLVFSCRAAQLPGNSFSIVSDEDGDDDVDLADFAFFQRDFGAPE